jgi:hypothetical protein
MKEHIGSHKNQSLKIADLKICFCGASVFSLCTIHYFYCVCQFLILMAISRIPSLVSGLKLEVEKGSRQPVNMIFAEFPVYNRGTQTEHTQSPPGQNPLPIP